MLDLSKSLAVLLLAFSSLSCNDSNKEKSGVNRDVQKPPAVAVHKNVPPNFCRIIGTVIEVDPQFLSSEKDHPCLKAPCQATVRVDSILGCGPGSTASIAVSQNIPIRFKFGLSPADTSLSNSVRLPGLSINSQFKADVLSAPTLDLGTESVPFFTVTFYEKIN